MKIGPRGYFAWKGTFEIPYKISYHTSRDMNLNIGGNYICSFRFKHTQAFGKQSTSTV